MKKGKIAMIITIGIVCFLLVLIIFMQFKVVYQTDITSIDTMRTEDLKTELANWKTKYKESEEKYKEIEEILKKYNEEANSDSNTKKNLEEELENLKLMIGMTDVEGQGLIIKLKDPSNVSESEYEDIENTKQKITASELMIIVNYLKDAGAEAISINNQRIINKTDFAQITSSGYMKINSQRVSSPFEIKVIGDPDYLKASLIGVGYVEKIKNWGQEINFEESKKVTIKKYDGKIEMKYIEN